MLWNIARAAWLKDGCLKFQNKYYIRNERGTKKLDTLHTSNETLKSEKKGKRKRNKCTSNINTSHIASSGAQVFETSTLLRIQFIKRRKSFPFRSLLLFHTHSV